MFDYFLAYTEWIIRSFWMFLVPILFMYGIVTRITRLLKEERIKYGK
jgi:hypothetical protein